MSVLSLPHANADCERCFSTVNCLKTKLRNKLNTDTVNGILHAKQYIKGGQESGKNCMNFSATKEILSRITKNTLYAKNDNLGKNNNIFNYVQFNEEEEDI